MGRGPFDVFKKALEKDYGIDLDEKKPVNEPRTRDNILEDGGHFIGKYRDNTGTYDIYFDTSSNDQVDFKQSDVRGNDGWLNEGGYNNPRSDDSGPIETAVDYFYGLGESRRYFGPASEFSDIFSQGKGAKAFEREVLKKYNAGKFTDYPLIMDDFAYRFSKDGRWRQTANTAEQVVGSWSGGEAYLSGESIHFVVKNSTGLKSLTGGEILTRHGLPSLPNIPGEVGGWRVPYGTIDMTIEWTIPVPKRP
jgi:hypothetical protein